MEKLLVVDDNPKNIQLLGTVLSEKQYDVEYAMTGMEAIELVKSEAFDLILMDVMMPGMDGFTACKKIKLLEGKSEIPLIFLTAKTDSESITKGFNVGGVDYITKPFNSSELLSRVSTHLKLKISLDKLKNVNEELEQTVQERTRELRHSNDKLKVANVELEKLDAAKSLFLKIISHEIRTPLNGIIGFSNLIKEQNPDETMEALIDLMDQSCSRLQKFALRSLLISELNIKGSARLKYDKLSLSDLVKEELHANKEVLGEKKLVLNVKVGEKEVYADYELIKDLIAIIISNAIKHSKAGGYLDIHGIYVKNNYELEIKDSGSGFPEKFLHESLKPFTNYEHIDENSGLDLLFCKLVIESHFGSLKLRNDKGAKVLISLPINRPGESIPG